MSSTEVKKREPFNYRNFQVAISRVMEYVDLVMSEDLTRLGVDIYGLSLGTLQIFISVNMSSLRKIKLYISKRLEREMCLDIMVKDPIQLTP